MIPERRIEIALGHHRAGRLREAEEIYRRILAIDPNHVDALHLLGTLAGQVGQIDAAIQILKRVILLKPGLAIVHNNLGNFQREMGRYEEAFASFRQAILLKPDLADAHNNLGIALISLRKYDEAVESLREAIRLQAGLGEAHGNLANALLGRGEADEAVIAGRNALRLRPDDAEIHSNLLFALNCQSVPDVKTTFDEHLAWAERHTRALIPTSISHGNDRLSDRRLRIGYVSADFRHHSVAFFLTALLQNRDRASFEIFGYASIPRPDDVTERIKHSCDAWRNVFGVSDEAAANLIRSDGIDILVDLSGHTSGNRLKMFARKPAPIQLTYLGYPNTTGMKAIDYRLTDALADPPGITESINVEKLWRLPVCAWCYDAPEDAPEIRPRDSGSLTFGCFNAISKINPEIIAIWADLLKRLPGSRLLIKSTGAGELSTRQRLAAQFAKHAISTDRFEMLPWVANYRQHLDYYNQVDIALDTYPYHGTTTTCEALWMGVPVISMAGQTHISRVGVSLLTNARLPELIANTPDDYISIAAALANNRSHLVSLRSSMREQLKNSPLLATERFAADVGAAYREIWQIRCASK